MSTADTREAAPASTERRPARILVVDDERSMRELLAIVLRSSLGTALLARMPALERNARVLQGVAGAAIVAIALWTGTRLLLA